MASPLAAAGFGAVERAVCEEVKARLALRSDRDLVRHALWRLALHAGLAVPIDVFRLLDSPPPARGRVGGGRRARGNGREAADDRRGGRGEGGVA